MRWGAALICFAAGCSPFVDGDRFRHEGDGGEVGEGDVFVARDAGEGADLGSSDVGPDLGPSDIGPRGDASDLGMDFGPGGDLGPLLDAGVEDDLGVEADLGVDLDSGPPDAGGSGDGGADLGPGPDVAPHDTGPSDLGTLPTLSLSPTRLREGEGVGVAVPIFVSGISFPTNARLSVIGSNQVIIMDQAVAPTGLVAAVRVPVDTSLAASATARVTLRVTAGGVALANDLELVLDGLDELRVTTSQSIAAADLAVYSYIAVASGQTLTLTGSATELARLEATGRIDLLGAIRVDQTGMPAGGCAGGGPNADGGCGAVGGRAGFNLINVSVGGGGGGGNATAGSDAPVSGVTAGTGGDTSTDEWIRDLAAARGGGGGGGGGVSGASGGASGGALEILSHGSLQLAGVLSATGSAGGAGTCGALGIIVGGGGGGGAGGTILVRARALVGSVGGSVDVRGGAGGAGNGCGAEGGDGGRGRSRFDAPDSTAELNLLPSRAISDGFGPSFDSSSSVLLSGANPQIEVTGPAARQLPYWVDGASGGMVQIRAGRSGTLTLSNPSVGLHEICLGVPGASLTDPQGVTCGSFAYSP